MFVELKLVSTDAARRSYLRVVTFTRKALVELEKHVPEGLDVKPPTVIAANVTFVVGLTFSASCSKVNR